MPVPSWRCGTSLWRRRTARAGNLNHTVEIAEPKMGLGLARAEKAERGRGAARKLTQDVDASRPLSIQVNLNAVIRAIANATRVLSQPHGPQCSDHVIQRWLM
jgi:hypothetical protein